MVDNPRTTDEESAVADEAVEAEGSSAAESADAEAVTDPDTTAETNGTAESNGTAETNGTGDARGDFIDLGSLALRLPSGARPRITGTPGGASHALYLRVPEGHISISLLAAPADRPLWPEFAEAISSAVQGGEGSVLTEEGEWGTEVQSGSGGELTWYIGRDGPLWLLYGTATGPAEHSARLASSVRALLREARVRRGHESLPDKTTLALRLPPGYQEPVETARDETRAERARSRGIGPAAGAAAAGAAAAGAAAVARPSELKPLPGPPASWHPSYHGTSCTGPQEAVRPAPAQPAPPPPVESPAASQWPEWLDDPFAPAPGEADTPRRPTGPDWRGPKVRTLLIVGALILLIGGLGTIASLTGAIDVSSRPTASDAQPARPVSRPGDEPSAIGPPADPAPPNAPAPGAPLPGMLVPPTPGVTAPGAHHGGPAATAPPSGAVPPAQRHPGTGRPPGGTGQHASRPSDSAHVAAGSSRQRTTSHEAGTRSTGGNLDSDATEHRTNRRPDRSDSANDSHSSSDRRDDDRYDDEADCDCDDDRSPRRSAGRDHGPLLGLLDTALGGL